MRRTLALLGVLVLATAIGGPAAGEEPEPVPPGFDGGSTPLVAVTVLLQTLNVELCSAKAGAAPALFDPVELARRALGRHHRDRTPAELAEFTELFALRFRHWYGGVLGRGGEPRLVAGTIDGMWGLLPARIVRSGQDRQVVYRLHRAAGYRWLVYDVEINGRSRLRTFYGEFDRIILTEGYRALVERLRTEVDRDGRGASGCSASLSGGDVLPAAAPDRTGADRPGRGRPR